MFKRLLGLATLLCALASPVAAQTVTKELPQSWWPGTSIAKYLTPDQLKGAQQGMVGGACKITTDLEPYFAAAETDVAIPVNSPYQADGGPEIELPPGCYYIGQSWPIHHTIHVRGVSVGGAGGEGTVINCAAGIKCIILEAGSGSVDSTGRCISSGSAGSATGTTFEDVAIVSVGGTLDQTSHGVTLCAPGTFSHVNIRYFQGDGYHIDTHSFGNADMWKVIGGHLLGNGANSRYAIYLRGADANTGLAQNTLMTNWGGGCIEDEDGIGNTFQATVCESGGMATSLIYAQAGGVTYMCRDAINPSDATHLATCQNTTPGTSTAEWWPETFTAGSAYNSATPYIGGPDYRCGQSSARCYFDNDYCEGPDTPADVPMDLFNGPALGISGTHGCGFIGVPAMLDVFSSDGNFVWSPSGVGGVSTNSTGGTGVEAVVGGGAFSNGDVLRTINAPRNGVDTFRLPHWVGGDLRWDWNNLDTDSVEICTGFTTGQQFGTGANQPYYCGFPRGVGIGDGTGATGAMRRFFICNGAAPTGATFAYAVGDVCWNYAVSGLGSVSCWANTAAGSPGTWVACSVLGADVRQAATNHFTAAQQFDAITNGTGVQAFNTTTTCTTGATIGAVCTTAAISLPVAEADTNYRISCTGLAPTAVPIVETVTKSASTFTITVAALTAVAAHFTSFDCIAAHN